MVGCAAEFCTNSSSKGYIMKILPRDPQRRALWLKNINRECIVCKKLYYL
ncbi:hypothetical protein X777_06683 [Ooceraea biroi]|uniref:THAP-type domain-containing protein n=1 Tax=Ooceraea biroi TaxID=2015173 RepID=A0A026WCI8_OOCBI|nr:hypothetical protein X777_06683 [Ooceraea biroi]